MLRRIPTRRANPSRFGVLLFTSALRRITLCGRGSYLFSCRRLVLWDPVVTHPCRAAALSIKERLD